MPRGRFAALIGLVTADIATLVELRAAPAALARGVTAPHEWINRVGLDRTLATVAATVLCIVAAWLALGLAAIAATRIPGAAGSASARLCRVVLPRVVMRLVAGSAGLSIVLAPVAAGAQQAPAAPPSSSSTSALPAPTWPSSAPINSPSAPSAPASTRSTPGPIWPSAPAATPPANPGTTRTSPPTSADRVRVAPGDSLWLVAARRLGPGATSAQIAAAWPRWYATNRAVIGDDPSHITPGLVLRVPAPSAQETP